MQEYTQQEAYSFFLNHIFNSRIDLGEESADPDEDPERASSDNFLNSYLAATLTSRLKFRVHPTQLTDISAIVNSSEGPRIRIMRLQRAADQGLVFHGVFTDPPESYKNVGIAYRSAASICDKIQDSIGEVFSYLDENLDLCMSLLNHLSTSYLSPSGITEAQVYRMTLAQTPDEALDSFLGYYSLFLKETSREKGCMLLHHLRESRKIAQQLNPNLIFPEIERLEN